MLYQSCWRYHSSLKRQQRYFKSCPNSSASSSHQKLLLLKTESSTDDMKKSYHKASNLWKQHQKSGRARSINLTLRMLHWEVLRSLGSKNKFIITYIIFCGSHLLTWVTRWFPGCKLNILLQLGYPQQHTSLVTLPFTQTFCTANY